MSTSERFFLVELTAALVRKRRIFCISLLALLGLGGGYQLFSAPTYKFVTLVEVAQDGEGTLLQPGPAIVSFMDNEWLPEIRREFRNEWGHPPGFGLSVDVIDGGYVLLSSYGKERTEEEVKWFHSNVTSKLTERQAELELRARTKLESQITLAKRALEAPEAPESASSPGTDLIETLISLEGKLAGLRAADVRVIAQRKDEPLGLGLRVRLGLVVFFSLVASVMVVLAYYFVRQVAELVKDENNP
ncbi:Wzz/FepE/Etk N-terminal domain-containing protein [Marinobacter nauticus]|uniref:Wzz/FepE/Etk N-terminal domain-containing protein n=1 Tax=Marinobacter nauticus TaxID=2743 RepID=UPI000EB4DB53|nr:Wzz/FepE/Etk N-terminal domain-containing protein [Marinobacter nauticus]RKR77529.1 hypothetical protein C7436_1234 [Marinobacter nauticus]